MNTSSDLPPRSGEPPELELRRATAADATALADLVNSAYRGDSSRAGWTTEADLLGGQRTDAEEIARLVATPGSVILLGWRGSALIASAHLEQVDAATAYLGMLVVKPGLQGDGLGRRLMAAAEDYARSEWGALRVQMQVITLRHELLAYYQRRGYRRTGEIRPFPADDPRFGLPKVAGLEFEVVEKMLA